MSTRTENVRRPIPVVDVAGALWPVHKAAAVCLGVVLAVGMLVFGGTAEAAAWIAGVGTLAVWWGGYAWYGRRWEHGLREHVERSRVESRTLQHLRAGH